MLKTDFISSLPSDSNLSRNVQNTKISDMHNLLSQGHDMDYIARHYHMDLALARHRSRPKEAVSHAQGFRSGETGGHGRIPAQLVAH